MLYYFFILKVRKTQPLVSDKQEIISLVAEFDPDDSPQYFKKATVHFNIGIFLLKIQFKELAEVYSHIRRIRGDGNCFYRAVLTALLERCFDHTDELNRYDFLIILKGSIFRGEGEAKK